MMMIKWGNTCKTIRQCPVTERTWIMTVDYSYYLKPLQHSELLLILFLKPTLTFSFFPSFPSLYLCEHLTSFLNDSQSSALDLCSSDFRHDPYANSVISKVLTTMVHGQASNLCVQPNFSARCQTYISNCWISPNGYFIGNLKSV